MAALANCCVDSGGAALAMGSSVDWSTAVVIGPVASCFYDGSDDDVGWCRQW